MHAAGCPSREQLSAFLLGTMAVEDADRVACHLQTCPGCASIVRDLQNRARTAVLDLPRAAPPPATPSGDLPTAATGLPPLSTPESPAPTQLGEYKLLEPLGEGGMGTVYKALHTKLGRTVALKVLPKERMADDRAVARFQREMMAVGALDHPNIVRATDASEFQGTHFLVMEYVEGLDLSELVKLGGPLPVADACELVRQAALGLECAHQHGLVHRDVKPSNVMLTPGGQAKLLDLGLARFQIDEPTGPDVTTTGQAMGTPDYMAPEQISDSHSVDIRADIYSLGCTFYQLLAGRPPYDDPKHKSTFGKMTAHVNEPAPPIADSRDDVPRGLAAVVDRMLAKDPADRFATPAEVAQSLAPFSVGCDLGRLLQQHGGGQGPPGIADSALAATDEFHHSALVGTRPETAPGTRPAAKPRRRLSSVAVGLALLAVVAGIAMAVVLRITRDGRETVIRVPEGSQVDVSTDGTVDVRLPTEVQPPPAAPQVEPQQADTPEATQVPDSPPLEVARIDPILPRELPDATAGGDATESTGTTTTPDAALTAEVGPAGDVERAADQQPPETVVQQESLAERIQRQPLDILPGSTLSRMALVAEPGEIEGVISWTVETRAHRGAVCAAVHSPDGGQIATGGADGMIRLWDPSSGELLRILVGHDGPITSLAWAPDGSVLGSASSDSLIRLWQIDSGLVLSTLRGHFLAVHSLAFSPDGLLLASAGADKSVRLWDAVSGARVQALRGHDEEAYCVAFSPDGTLLASGAGDGKVILWDTASGQVSQTFEARRGTVRGLAFSPEGKTLAAACSTPGLTGSVQLWDVASGEPLERFVGRMHGDNCLAFSPDGELLAAGGPRDDGSIRVFEVATGELRQTLKMPSGTDPTWCVGFSPDGRVLIAGGDRGEVPLWEPISGRLLRTLPAHCGQVTSLAFSPDEGNIACGYLDGTVRLWQGESGEPVLRLSPESGPIARVAWSSDAKTLAVAYRSTELIELWDTGSGERIAQLRAAKGPVEHIAFSPDGKNLATGGGQAQVWDVATGELLLNPPGYGNGIAFSPDGATLAVAAGGDVRLLEAQSGKPKGNLYSSRALLRVLAFSPEGKTLAAGSEDDKVYLWDIESRRLLNLLSDHKTAVDSLCWLEDGRSLVSGSRTEALVWQVESGRLLQTLKVDGGAVSANSRLIASRGPSTVRLYQLDDGRLLRTIVALRDQRHFTLPSGLGDEGFPDLEEELVRIIQTEAGQQTLKADDR